MKRMLILAIAVVALVFTTTPDASAQSYNNGYNFGTGVGQSFLGGFGGNRFTAPPYFAQFPPVYYNGIVRRSYGVSPFAAPPGIVPVEMTVPHETAQPLHVRNPFVKQSLPVSAPQKQPVRMKKSDISNQTTWVKNPFYVPEPAQVAEVEIDAETEAILIASADVAKATLIEIAGIAAFKFN